MLNGRELGWPAIAGIAVAAVIALGVLWKTALAPEPPRNLQTLEQMQRERNLPPIGQYQPPPQVGGAAPGGQAYPR